MPTASLSRRLLAFALAVLGTYAIACISATQGALAALPEIAQPISTAVRLQTTVAEAHRLRDTDTTAAHIETGRSVWHAEARSDGADRATR